MLRVCAPKQSAAMNDKVTIANEQMFAEVRRLLAEGHSVQIPLKGWSMHPFFRESDTAVLRARPSYSPDEAVLAEISPGRFVLHRIKSIEGERVTLQGDGNVDGVEHCRMQDICGSVESLVRKSGSCKGPRNNCSRWWRRLPESIRWRILVIYRKLI